VPLLDPAAIASEVAALTLPVVPRATCTPPDPAAPLRVTVQLAVALGFKTAGLHATELIVGAGELGLTVPPAAVSETPSPAGVEAMALLNPKLMADEPDTVADTVATVPFPIAFWFGPLAMQVYCPDAAAHVSVLPAAVNAVPATAERFVTLAG
jgi:hypothetical protein